MAGKHYILFQLALILCITDIAAQIPYYSMPDTNAQWKESAFYLAQLPAPVPVYDDYIIYPDGDTLVNGLTYTKMFQSGTITSSSPPAIYYAGYRFAFREDVIQKKVFILPQNSSAEQLLYDFNLVPGDTLPATYNNDSSSSVYNGNFVLAIDSVLVGQSYHNRYLLNPVINGTGIADSNYAIIEGVGSTLGFYQKIEPPFESGSQLLCFRHDSDAYPHYNNCPFTVNVPELELSPTGLGVIPNPVISNGLIIPEKEIKSGVLKIYAADGNLLSVIENVSGNKIPISRNHMNCGIYLFTLSDRSSYYQTGKFIIAD